MTDRIPRMVYVSEGNPGAINVLSEIHRDHLDRILSLLEQYNIRGHHIWIIYKQHCHQNIHEFECFPFENYSASNY
jgi:hypothetical protein